MGALPASADKARFVRGMFDAIASRYDLMNRLMTAGQDERWRRLAADAVHPEAIGVALDLGAGTGDLSLALATCAPYAPVIALDFSPNMLALTQRKAAESCAGRHVLPVLADAMRLPFKRGSIDAIVTGFALRNVDDVATVFGECARVLTPGGRIAALELTPVRRSPIPGFAQLFDLYFGRVVPLLGAAISGKGFAYRYLPSSVKVFPDADRLTALLRDAGLTDVAYHLLALGTVALHTATKPLPMGEAARSAGKGTLTTRQVDSPTDWNALLAALPNAHLLQSWQWAELKRETGWAPTRLAFERDGKVVAAASVSIRRIPKTPLRFAYCQKGPALDYADLPLFRAVLDHLAVLAREKRCIFLTVDPDVEWRDRAAADVLYAAGYRPRPSFQAPSTVCVDVRDDDKTLLGRMSATWRRYVNRAQRDGVTVRIGSADDLPKFFALMQETERRQGFVIRPESYFRSAFHKLHDAGLAELFLGELDGKVESAVVAARLGRRAWYLWGGTAVPSKSRAAYAVQWRAMQWARDAGCDTYDMWGAPDDPEDKDDPLAGVYYFKRGFGGRHVRTLGAYDYVTSPALYQLWQRALPRYIAFLRRLRGERAAPLADH